jgi:predicted nucleotidyltransferase
MSQEVIEKLKDYFKQNQEVSSVILFGSYAKGIQNEHSDIDLAILTKSILSADLKIRIISDLALIFRKKIDIIDLRNTHVPLLQEILTKGIWLQLESNTVKEILIQRMIFEAEDLQPLRENIQNTKIKRFINK